MTFQQEVALKRIKDRILSVIIIILLIISTLMITSKIKTGRANIFGYRPFIVQSESMLPDYKVGTLLIAKVVEDVDVGEVYAYKNALGMTIVHRLVDITEEGYIFKGDNNDFTDKPVQIEDIHYKIIRSY